jgi:peptidoglycan-N-acetylglucosamine deacetylase
MTRGRLSVTIDVDGEAGLPDGGAGYSSRLSSRSERTYGIDRGLPRILEALDELGVAATFYVPGVTALRHADAIAALAGGRHEIGHHGHTHRRPDALSPSAQREEIALGIDALVHVTGRTPRGYRAPAWELTPDTLEALTAHGFRHDSSLMGDDRPYRLAAGRIVELPVHWALDDAPHFARATDVAGLLATWLEELSSAAREARHTTITLHPEILGRGHRIDVLRRVLDAAARSDMVCVTHADAAAELRSRAA